MAERTLVRGGEVCDGSGADPVARDVLIEDGVIAALLPPASSPPPADTVIDASGLVVAPGFIDAHSHGDTTKLEYPDNRSKVRQGITTEVDGNCGFSAGCVPGSAAGFVWKDLAEYARLLDRRPAATNTVVLCGHNDLRRVVMGDRDRRATAEELDRMRRLLAAAFASGAAGWSTGLTYFPGKFADTTELLALSELTRGTRKVYATHLRSEGDALLESADEALAIARAGSGRLQISHLKTMFPRNFGKLDALVAKLEAARRDGLTLHADRYPYIYTSTRIGQALPPPYDQDPGIAAKLRGSAAFRDEITAALAGCPRDLPTTILPEHGETLAEIAARTHCSVERVCMMEIMRDPETCVAFRCMSEDNLRRILALPWVCAGTDSISRQLDDPADHGHPRGVGAFPRFFRLTRELCGVGEAVRRLTGLPAAIYRIPRRGLVKCGFVADLVIFDPERFDSAAGFRGEAPAPSGIARVMLAGNTVWHSGEPDVYHRFGRFLPIER